MAALQDRTLGFVMLVIAVAIFTYYTTWVLVLPFVDAELFIHDYFPPPHYGVIIPAFLFVVCLAAVFILLGVIILKGRKKKGEKKQQ